MLYEYYYNNVIPTLFYQGDLEFANIILLT